MTTDISTKNTKPEILEAYHAALKQLREVKKESRSDEKREADKKQIVAVASQQTAHDIVNGLSQLKLSLTQSLEDIEEKLLREQKNLLTLQQAIAVQQKELEDLYAIGVNADSLAALLVAQKEKSAQFNQEMITLKALLDEEMTEKRLHWKKEQLSMETLQKEQALQLKITREREEEAYLYQRDLARQKDQDAYFSTKASLEQALLEKQTAFEHSFSERERLLKENEQRLAELNTAVEVFPERLKQTIEETEKSVSERLRFQYDYEAKLSHKEVEGERKLHQQMVAALENKILQQEAHIKQLTEKETQANSQVQEIALKAIEGASSQRYTVPHATYEKMELAKV